MELIKPYKLSHWLSLYRLYREAFPASERKPISMILQTRKKGRADIWCAIKDGRFAGLAVTVNSPDTVLLDYLAVCKRCRNGGIGSFILQQLQKEKGLAYLFICHNLALVQQFCDKIIVLYDGKIVEHGLPDEVILQPQSDYARRLVDAIF